MAGETRFANGEKTRDRMLPESCGNRETARCVGESVLACG